MDNDNLELLLKYFSLSETQIEKFAAMGNLYRNWNQKINLISRKDIEHLYLHHILHSLSIVKIAEFTDGTTFIDAGTGGGFPGIPLAIMLPECSFLLVDSIGKKIKAVNGIIDALGLQNVRTIKARMEEIDEKAEFITGRAVSNVGDFYSLAKTHILQKTNNTLANGVIYLAGGDVTKDIAPFGRRATVYSIRDWFEEDYFEGKKIAHIRV